ncbi:MAG: hypothetical protein LBJ08_08040, partial [Bifidobacteriaceae bacterium]|nr:hypothetical protein [Bifidobacteriaceae bacterium]
QRMGLGYLSRAADAVNTGLTQMTGATSPRLQLELLAARMLATAASVTGAAGATSATGATGAARAATAPGTGEAQASSALAPQPASAAGIRPLERGPAPVAGGLNESKQATPQAGGEVLRDPSAPGGWPTPGAAVPGQLPNTGLAGGEIRPGAKPSSGSAASHPGPLTSNASAGAGVRLPASHAPSGPAAPGSPPANPEALTAAWPKILARLRGPIAAIMRNNATLHHAETGALVFSFDTAGPLEFFRRGHSQERLAEAATDILGQTVRWVGMVGSNGNPSASPAPTRAGSPAAPAAHSPVNRGGEPSGPDSARASGAQVSAGPPQGVGWGQANASSDSRLVPGETPSTPITGRRPAGVGGPPAWQSQGGSPNSGDPQAAGTASYRASADSGVAGGGGTDGRGPGGASADKMSPGGGGTNGRGTDRASADGGGPDISGTDGRGTDGGGPDVSGTDVSGTDVMGTDRGGAGGGAKGTGASGGRVSGAPIRADGGPGASGGFPVGSSTEGRPVVSGDPLPNVQADVRPGAPSELAPASQGGSAAAVTPGRGGSPALRGGAEAWSVPGTPFGDPPPDPQTDGEPDFELPSPDDPDAEKAGLIGAPLILQELGGEVISETTNPGEHTGA